MPIGNRIVKEIPALYKQNITVVNNRDNVTYYARVSTESEEQEDSYERQKAHFEERIKSHPEWNYVEGYADWGVTGTKAEARKNFMRMIEDCRAGKINKILCKSISRFGRNTLDTLKYIRELRELGISVEFETQAVDTMTPGGDLLITILAAMAEQESRTMSTNIKWAYEKRFKEGKVLINYTGSLGYTKVGNEYAIVESEAEIVRRIFREYLAGASLRQIAENLNKENITTKKGNKWLASGIEGVLENERYTGDAILGKTFKVDVVSKSRKKNEGQAPRYYVQNSHPAIISKEMFEMAQAERERRVGLRSSVKTGKGRYSSRYPYSGLLICAECGGKFRRFGRKVASGEYVPTWVCVTHQKHSDTCKMLPIKEEDIDKAYRRAVERLLGNVTEVKAAVKKIIDDEIKIDCDANLTPIQQAIEKAQKSILELFQRRRRNEVSMVEYESEYAELSERITELQKRETELKTANINSQITQMRLANIIDTIDGAETDYTDTRIMRLWLNCIKVNGKHELEFQFKCGINITEQI